MARHWGLALSLSLISGWPAIAAAHPVTVDGSAADWFGVAGNGFNVGRVARRPGDLGEFFWVDEAADTRTDLSGGGPETGTDILSVRATATPTALCMLIQSGASMLPGAV